MRPLDVALGACTVAAAIVGGRAWWKRLGREGAEEEDRAEGWLAALVLGLALLGGVGLFLGEIGYLRPWVLLVAVAMVGLPALRGGRGMAQRSGSLAPALGVAGLAALVLAPGGEYVMGGRDPGVYIATGVHLAREGNLAPSVAELPGMAPETRALFLPARPGATRGPLVAGFEVDGETGRVAPQFMHLLPVYLAVGYWVGGIGGLTRVPALIGVMAIVAVALFARRLRGALAGVAVGVLLCANLAQVWCLRVSFAEGVSELGLFAALLAIERARATGATRWGVVAAAGIGLGLLARVDAALALPPLALGVGAAIAWRGAGEAPFAKALRPALIGGVAFGVWGALHGWLFSQREYTNRFGSVYLQLLAVALVVSMGAALAGRERVRALAERLLARGRVGFGVTSAILVGVALFAWFVRPSLGPFHAVRGQRSYDEELLVRVGWYLSPVGVGLAVVGLVAMLRAMWVGRRAALAPFLAVALAVAGALLWKGRISPDHPWQMRRFVPVVVPSLTIAVVWLLVELYRRERRWLRGVAVVIFAGLLGYQARMLAPFAALREGAGAYRALAAAAERIPERAIVLYPWPGRGGSIDAVAVTPLRFLFGRTVLPVTCGGRCAGREERRRFEAQLDRWRSEGREVVVVTTHDGMKYVPSERYRWQRAEEFAVRVPVFGLHYQGPPWTPDETPWDFGIFRPVAATGACGAGALRAGGSLVGWGAGFYPIGRDDDGPFRATAPPCALYFPACAGPSAVRRVRIEAKSYDQSTVEVGVSVGEEAVGRLTLTPAWQRFELAIPEAATVERDPLVVSFAGPQFLFREVALLPEGGGGVPLLN